MCCYVEEDVLSIGKDTQLVFGKQIPPWSVFIWLSDPRLWLKRDVISLIPPGRPSVLQSTVSGWGWCHIPEVSRRHFSAPSKWPFPPIQPTTRSCDEIAWTWERRLFQFRVRHPKCHVQAQFCIGKAFFSLLILFFIFMEGKMKLCHRDSSFNPHESHLHSCRLAQAAII